jgi:hypothetical protein
VRPPPGHPALAAEGTTRGEVTEMLATLGFNLVFAVFVCSMILLICWAYDTAKAGVEARRSLAAGAKLAVPHYVRPSAASSDDSSCAERPSSWAMSRLPRINRRTR